MTANQQRNAAIVLAFYRQPSLWLERRTDVTVVQDLRHVSWTTTLQIRVDHDGLRASGVQAISAEEAAHGILFPVLLKRRELATGVRIRNHQGENVPGVPWRQTRPMMEGIFIDMAAKIIRGSGRRQATLDPAVELALRRFGGDVDEVKLGGGQIVRWANASAKDQTRTRQASLLLKDAAMNHFLAEHIEGFLVIVRAALRPNLTCELFIEHESKIGTTREGRHSYPTLRLPVGASPSYQFEIRLPTGAVFDRDPDLVSLYPGLEPRRISSGNYPADRLRPIPRLQTKQRIEPWFEVWEKGIAGFAANEPRGKEWRLRLEHYVHWRIGPVSGKVAVRNSVRNEREGLVSTVRWIARSAAAIFAVGLVARGVGFHAGQGATATLQPLLAFFPSVVAVLVLQRSDVPTREFVARTPRRWLVAAAGATFLGAATLAIQFPDTILGHKVPLLSQVGWGWRAGVWALLSVISFAMVGAVEVLSRRVW